MGCAGAAACLLAMTLHTAHAARQQQTPLFSGVWSSTQCEPYPGGPFAQRQLTIAGRAFQLEVTSFADARCTIPTLRTCSEGTFIVRGPSPTLPETSNVEFAVQQVRLTPYVLNTAEFLNTTPPGTCGRERWFVGIEQELAATGGCPLIGIHLRRPLVEYDIASVQGNLLFLGQRPVGGGYLTSPALRPTAFGAPLARTGDVVILLPPVGGDLSTRRPLPARTNPVEE